VALTCNPSYSGDRDQEDCGSKPAQTNKKGLVEWLKPQYHKEEEEEEKEEEEEEEVVV
jgi:hypothetical protein